MVERGIPPTHAQTPADARVFYLERRAVTQPDASDIAVIRELSAPEPYGPIPQRLYHPLPAARCPLPSSC